MELGGAWQAATADDTLRRHFPEPDLADDDWERLEVPGHWRSSPAFAASDGPLFYRRRFQTPAGGDGAADDRDGAGRRTWLTLDGLFYQGDVWLDGSYLGDTEGYFVPHTFEVTEALRARGDHLLALEVTCSVPEDLGAKHNLTGVFQHWDCIDPSWNPGGIWAPVHLDRTGPVRIAALKVLCPDARPERAVLHLEAELDAADATTVAVTTVVRRHLPVPGRDTAGRDTAGRDTAGRDTEGRDTEGRDAEGRDAEGRDTAGRDTEGRDTGGRERASVPGRVLVERVAEEALASGRNLVRWRVTVDQPDLWWPHSLGSQPLHDVVVRLDVSGVASDERTVVTGLRQIRMRNFVATVNGERLFLKGSNLGPVRRELAEAGPEECERDVRLARDAGLDLLRLHAHVSRPELYRAADRAGMLIWQDLPLQWGYANVRRQAVRQARAAVRLLGHHPSIAVWCGHNEPFGVTSSSGGAPAGRSPGGEPTRHLVAGQFLPGRNKTVLDNSIRRTLERADGSRPVVAHSGVLPHPAGGTDSHLYAGWLRGDERDLPGWLARLPVLARFVSEFGAQAVPATADWMDPDRWPDLDWERLGRAHGMAKEIFDRRVPPTAYPSFEGWREATQQYQATLLRRHIETLRRLKYRPSGGFCQFLLADAQPAVSASVLDHERRPKLGYGALSEACAPVIVVADRPAPSYRSGERVRLAVHAVSDLRFPISGARATVVAAWPGGGRSWTFSGDIPADSCTRIGRLDLTLPDDPSPDEGRDVDTLPLSGDSSQCLKIDLGLDYEVGGAPHRVTNTYQSVLRR